jgi:cytochrome c553
MRAAMMIIGLVACAFAWAAPPGDPAAGKRKTVTCNGCHGQSGMKSMPSLGGQSTAYFIAAMWAYKDNVRSHATMRDVAGSLSARDFANLAAYYAEAPDPTPSEEASAPASGARCAICHGADGWEVVAPDAARLAGQKVLYLEQVLRDYRSGSRKHPVMQEQAAALSDQDILELAAYYASRNGLFVK